MSMRATIQGVARPTRSGTSDTSLLVIRYCSILFQDSLRCSKSFVFFWPVQEMFLHSFAIKMKMIFRIIMLIVIILSMLMIEDGLTCTRLRLVRQCRREGQERKKHQRWSRWQDPSFDNNNDYLYLAFSVGYDGHTIVKDRLNPFRN